MNDPKIKLREIAPRLGKAWDEYREEHRKMARHFIGYADKGLFSPVARMPCESNEVLEERIYRDAMVHNLKAKG